MSIVSDIVLGKVALNVEIFGAKCSELDMKGGGNRYIIDVDGIRMLFELSIDEVYLTCGDGKYLARYKISDSTFIVMGEDKLKSIAFNANLVKKYYGIWVDQVSAHVKLFS